MKKSIITILILLFPVLAFAQELVLPFHLDIRAENETKEAGLIFNHGREAFDNCAQGQDQDKSNPYSYAKRLREAEACLAGQKAAVANCQNGKIGSGGICVSIDTGCKERYGEFSYASGNIIAGNNECACAPGYVWNEDRSACAAPCPENLLFYSVYRDQNGNLFQPFCKEPDLACQEEFGPFSRFAGQDGCGRTACACVADSRYDHDSRQCFEPVIVAGYEAGAEEIAYALVLERERERAQALDIGLARRLAGRILIQAEEKGEAWYVNPGDHYRYYLSSPAKALAVMRQTGLGARHEFIIGHEFFPEHVLGRILIDVDDLGKAYYISPLDQRAYYLGTPAQAFALMAGTGLGISNEDLGKIMAAGEQ